MFETKNTTLYSCFSTAAWCFFRTKNQTILITDEISDKRVECSACVFRYVAAPPPICSPPDGKHPSSL
ncbi:MAG: hypothetical protein ACLUJ0_10465, partial [Ruthenibacterium lactatiformans]